MLNLKKKFNGFYSDWTTDTIFDLEDLGWYQRYNPNNSTIVLIVIDSELTHLSMYALRLKDLWS